MKYIGFKHHQRENKQNSDNFVYFCFKKFDKISFV